MAGPAARDAALAAGRGLPDAGQAERLSLLLGGIFGSATEPDRYCSAGGITIDCATALIEWPVGN